METNQSTYLTAVNIKISKQSNQITDLSSQPLSPIVNTIDITPENDTIFSIPQKLETRNQVVEFLKYASQRSNLLKTEFVNYLLKDENFTNMNETEKFLREKALENINIINKNDLEIAKKKEEYDKIIMELNREINNNFQANWEKEEENYTKTKEDLENQIKDKKHEFGMLQNTYKKEYKERYLIVQQQKNEVQNIKINSKQYEKYNILKKKISFEANQKENLLLDVKKYVEQSRKIFSEEIDNKTKAFKDLELEVHILKESTADIEKSLNAAIDRRNKVTKLVDEQIEINNCIKNCLENLSNEYFLNKMILLRNTEMNNLKLDDLIKQYNEISNKTNNLEKVLVKANQEITYLNGILYKLKKEYNEKKEENKKIIKRNKNKNKTENSSENNNEEEKILKDKIMTIIKKNKDSLITANIKTNFLVLCYKYLFQSSKILFKSLENSRINFNYNLEQTNIDYNKIIQSNYFELINFSKNFFDKMFTTNGKIFEHPKQFLIFGLKIFLFFVSTINNMISNVLNISCFNSEDFIDKFPISQFNSRIFSFKESGKKNLRESANDFILNKEKNKVIIKNFLSQENINMYLKHLNQNSAILSKKNEIFTRSIDDYIKINKVNNKNNTINHKNKNNPTRIFFNFMNNNNLPTQLKKSKYIRNHPTSTLLSLKRFFCKQDQINLFMSSTDLNNKSLNEKYTTRNKLKQISYDNNITYLKSPQHKKETSYRKNKNINDSYLSKEYMYEIEVDEYKEKSAKKKSLENSPKHSLKYYGQDPQQQLIFQRMMDIRNLELQSANINNNSANINNLSEEKIDENKFYEMYDKFKKKYFFNPKKVKEGLSNSYKNIKSKKNINEKSAKNKRNSMSNDINLKRGFKFIRNNSDFFYGIKGNNSIKNKYKKLELPDIKNNKNKNNKNDGAKNDS